MFERRRRPPLDASFHQWRRRKRRLFWRTRSTAPPGRFPLRYWRGGARLGPLRYRRGGDPPMVFVTGVAARFPCLVAPPRRPLADRRTARSCARGTGVRDQGGVAQIGPGAWLWCPLKRPFKHGGVDLQAVVEEGQIFKRLWVSTGVKEEPPRLGCGGSEPKYILADALLNLDGGGWAGFFGRRRVVWGDRVTGCVLRHRCGGVRSGKRRMQGGGREGIRRIRRHCC
mmetsp:Transcript_12193/g.40068  ORF Transcript_12193/g.40068 Transcript_12193/m.40068 type:complete len:227 (+) Transcript_12193:1180-1860(+)